jgi:formate dehydrogenase iron-sulfur subunit
MPACAKACPTQSIRFGEINELRAQARTRVEQLQDRGYADAQVYDPRETTVGGTHALFVILGEPEAYNFPPAPEVPTVHLRTAWSYALGSAAVLLLVVWLAFVIL